MCHFESITNIRHVRIFAQWSYVSRYLTFCNASPVGEFRRGLYPKRSLSLFWFGDLRPMPILILRQRKGALDELSVSSAIYQNAISYANNRIRKKIFKEYGPNKYEVHVLGYHSAKRCNIIGEPRRPAAKLYILAVASDVALQELARYLTVAAYPPGWRCLVRRI